MPRVGFEPAIPVFERAKTVYTLDRAATVIDQIKLQELKMYLLSSIGEELFLIIGGVGLSPLGTAATSGLLYKPQMIDDDCGAIGGMKIGR
jgi:hypothetical protein